MTKTTAALVGLDAPSEPTEPAAASPPASLSGAASATGANARLRAMFESDFTFIWRVMRRLGVPPGRLDDAVAHVFLVATRKIADIDPGHERAFLFGTALRVAADARRAQAVGRETCVDTIDEAAHPAPGPEELIERKRALELLDAVLDAMPFDLRTVFVLFEIEGMSTHEIAPLLGLPRGTVSSRLRRAREEFKEITKRLRARAEFRGGGR
jgi:RNA polymerase sigma-70 factor (ECF subfamily)